MCEYMALIVRSNFVKSIKIELPDEGCIISVFEMLREYFLS